MGEIKAKLVRIIYPPNNLPWYFTKYELECIECGEHYFNGRYDSRTVPYCVACRKRHEQERILSKKLQQEKEYTELLRKAEAYDRLIMWMKNKKENKNDIT